MKSPISTRLFRWRTGSGTMQRWTRRFVITQPMKWLPHNLDLILPGLVLAICALGAVILTAHKAYDVIDFASKKYFSDSNKIGVQRTYLSRSDYFEYAPTLVRLNPGVGFVVSQNDDSAVVMTISNEELFPDLMMALHTLQSFKPGVAWEMVEFCVRKCPEGAIARASVKGFKQEIR